MSTRYIITFVVIMTVVVALLLTGFREVTKERSAMNADLFNKRAILAAVSDYLGEGVYLNDLSDEQILQIFETQIQQVVVNSQGQEMEGVMAEDVDLAQERKKTVEDRKLPIFIFTQGNEKYYIVSVRGNGLWDEIWGSIALGSDLNTIAGASFDHKGETPGLGAEIKDNQSWVAQFKGTKLYDENGRFVSVVVRKGGAVDEEHEVDGISGSTITGDGVTRMLYNGIQLYEPYLQQLRDQQGGGNGASVTGMRLQERQ